MHRRDFLRASLAASLAGASGHFALAEDKKDKPLFDISLAEWSFNKSLFGKKMDNLDFPRVAHEDYGIDAVEYVNQFFKDKAHDEGYLKELKKRASDNGVTNVLIMIDGEGDLSDPDKAKRNQAVENHQRWVDAAAALGCHAIRVNTGNPVTNNASGTITPNSISPQYIYASTFIVKT